MPLHDFAKDQVILKYFENVINKVLEYRLLIRNDGKLKYSVSEAPPVNMREPAGG